MGKNGKMKMQLAKRTPKVAASQLERVKKGTIVPVHTKSHLHNYFADKMAVFSNIIGFIYHKTGDAITGKSGSNPIAALYSRLIKMRADFLDKYHQETSKKTGLKSLQIEDLKPAFEHIQEFENKVVSEISQAGISPLELNHYNTQQLQTTTAKK